MSKKIVRKIIFTFLLVAISSGAFAKKSSKKKAEKFTLEEPQTISFHDNCPRTTAALKEEVSLKVTIPGYRGIISVTYKSVPEEKHAYPVTGYYECCERIRDAMEESSGKKYSLRFFTGQNKEGTEVNLSDAMQATESVILLLKQKETDVYAFYEEIAEVPDSAETPQNMEDTLQPELESVD